MPAWVRASFPWFVVLFVLVGCGLLLWLRSDENEWPEDPFVAERAIPPQPPTWVDQVKSAADLGDRIAPTELILGVTIEKESRAYPLSMLTLDYGRKILNDALADQPILVTWCDACHNGVVFKRLVNGTYATFGVFGSRWKQNMTMMDEETKSVWSHFDGQARLGLLKGSRLEIIPSVVTDWQTWRRRHPTGTVAWFEGERDSLMSRRLYDDPGRFVLGIAEGRRGQSWSLADLAEHGIRNDVWRNQPVVAMLVSGGAGARLYSRLVADRTLTFELRENVPTDRETGSSWDALTGQAIAGELTGKRLRALPAMVTFRDAWSRFYSRSK